MRSRAGIIGAGLLGWVLTAHGFTSPYSSMGVPGNHNTWNTAPSMVLVADNVWVCTQTLSSANGEFKFAANGDWTTNWGCASVGAVSVVRMPAVAAAPTLSGENLQYTGVSNGLYRFTFNDSTLTFRLEWAGASPLPLPVYTNMAVVGDFNSWTPSPTSQLTNNPANTNIWVGTITLETNTSFQFQPHGNPLAQWGPPQVFPVSVPSTNLSACGNASYTLSGFIPGTFRFELNTSNATFAISQTATQDFTVTTMSAQGDFIGVANPPGNMTRLGSTTLWESDHHITNSGSLTLRFSANGGAIGWGPTNGTPAAVPPAAGTLFASQTNFAGFSSIVPGRYRITFDHLTGAYTLRQLYTEASGINLITNAGFEVTTAPDGGDALGWAGFQAWPKNVVNHGFAPHSGNWCGSIDAKWDENAYDYGSFSQYMPVEAGKTYRASAWLKASPTWVASSMQIKIEWLDATNGVAGSESVVNILGLTTNWVKYAVEASAPANAATSHVVILCSGATNAGSSMHVDDAEMRTVAGRDADLRARGAASPTSRPSRRTGPSPAAGPSKTSRPSGPSPTCSSPRWSRAPATTRPSKSSTARSPTSIWPPATSSFSSTTTAR